jgi:alanyl-tRNA synthetase
LVGADLERLRLRSVSTPATGPLIIPAHASETGSAAPGEQESPAVPSANEIREHYLDFFRRHGHTIVPSSPVVPHGDPTLLFTNAGMNQFKDVFLGTGSRNYKRAADTQKCIRAGGKHNDLDDVGKDTYHHTFFEMLGNWSFGDYFKKDAIVWAWELLTKEWGLDPARLHVTVFEGDPAHKLDRDDEAAAIWRDVVGVRPDHIHLGSKKDNFWLMGDTGPCGPCTEVHYDRTPGRQGGRLVNRGDASVIEIWNLVFIQFNRSADGTLTPLPAKHVDTGMGFERITAVLEGKDSNYDTSVFAPVMHAIAELAGQKYLKSLTDPRDIAFRVIADHLRMATFAITDGARPGPAKAGSVLRSVVRRAVRYGYQELGLKEPFLHKLVPVLTDHMGGAFPELKAYADNTREVLQKEEADFLKVIDRGIRLFDESVKRAESAGGVVSGDDLFELHSTHGFPADMAAALARDKGLKPDLARFETRFEAFRLESGKRRDSIVVEAVNLEGADRVPPSEFVGYDTIVHTYAKPLAIWNPAGKRVDRGVSHAIAGDDAPAFDVAVALDKTPFYVEAGGQVGDTGTLLGSKGRLEVLKTARVQGSGGPVTVHYGKVLDGVIEGNDHFTAEIAAHRIDTMRNHTATHLLNWALRKVLGDEVHQKSSLVDWDKTRFGFSHDKALTAEEIAEVERLVNVRVAADEPVTALLMPLIQAKNIHGLRAVFGEKYPDPVRVVMIGADKPEAVTLEHSVEFCGGTHVRRTGEIGFFKIVSEEAESRGVRRITAVTGRGAVEHVQRMEAVLNRLAGDLKTRIEDIPARVEALQAKVAELEKTLKKGAAADLQGVCDGLLESAPTVGGIKLIVGEIPKVSDDAVRGAIDRLKTKAGQAAVVLGCREEGKAVIYSAATAEAVAKGVHAGKVLTEAAAVIGGKGGGKPEGIAQGGGNLADKLPDALAKAKEMLAAALK